MNNFYIATRGFETISKDVAFFYNNLTVEIRYVKVNGEFKIDWASIKTVRDPGVKGFLERNGTVSYYDVLLPYLEEAQTFINQSILQNKA